MLLFACKSKKQHEAQGFLLKLVNNNCAGMDTAVEGPRTDGRVRIVVPVLITPVQDGKPRLDETFAALTKEVSCTGVSLVLASLCPLDEAIVTFRWESGVKHLHGKARHLNPMGAGFYHLGLEAVELLNPAEHPELRDLRL